MGNSVFHPFFLLWGRRSFFPTRLFLFLTQDIIDSDQRLHLHWILKGILQTCPINLSFFGKKSIEFFCCLRNALLGEDTLMGNKTVATRLTCAATIVCEVI